ncbi:MAG: cytidylate kinase-like family protein [Muribaculaceae bacterium]|nr:cytidylate kinase-like family protein [Muribaculaceae bacterium]
MKPETTEGKSRLPEDLIIVIGRQFGSGGRRTGRSLATRLGLRYYDKELLSEGASEFGFSPEILARADEKKPSLLSQFFCSAFGMHDNYGPETLSGEGLYKVQSNVIRKIGERGGCVIVGRTADYILRDHDHLVSIFLHAPLSHRVTAICKRGDAPDCRKAEEKARKADKQREEYYNYFTGRRWGTASNYDFTLDASQMDEEEAASLIEEYLKRRFFVEE